LFLLAGILFQSVAKKLLILLLVLFFLCFGIGIVIFSFANLRKARVVLVPSSSPSPTVQPTPASTPSHTPLPSPSPKPIARARAVFPKSAFSQKISTSATYIKEDRIGTIRPALEAYSQPIYRTSDNALPLVNVVNKYGGRTENWPIPTSIKTSTGEDNTMSVIHTGQGKVFDFWNAQWQADGSISAGGMKDFLLSGDGLSHPSNQRVTAAGFSHLAGTVIAEDLPKGNSIIPHALVLSLPHQLIKRDAFIAPAIGGEATKDNTGDIPLGVRYALPKTINVEDLKVHPFTKVLVRTLQEYGAIVSDRNNAGQYKGKYVATLKIEVGLLRKLYGKNQDALNPTIQQEMYNIIQEHGLHRVN
jgi:hypothetical protein